MSELTKETTPKTTFMSRSVADNTKKIQSLEEEIEAMSAPAETPATEPVAEPEKDEGLSKEEASWKKRYSDLRSHQAKMEKDLKDKIAKLEEEHRANQAATLPKTQQEVEAWVKKFPDVARIVQELARRETDKVGENLQERIRAFEEMTEKEKLKAEKKKLLELHPDFDQIAATDAFVTWLDTRSKLFQDAVYEGTDHREAAEVMDVYKAAFGIKAKTQKDAALAVKTQSRTVPAESDSQWLFTETQIRKMSAHEYEAKEADIMAAMKAGKVKYDITGAAR